MKMKSEHYKFIKEQLSVIPVDDLNKHFKSLEEAQKNKSQRIKDIDMRFRWDCLHSRKLSLFISSHLYPYLDDGHIDTALRQIAKELNFPSKRET